MKKYTKKIHLSITDIQLKKLQEDSKVLGVKQVDIVRNLIDKKHVYANILGKKIRLDAKYGNLLNQAVHMLNSTGRLGEKEQKQIERVETWLRRSHNVMKNIARK